VSYLRGFSQQYLFSNLRTTGSVSGYKANTASATNPIPAAITSNSLRFRLNPKLFPTNIADPHSNEPAGKGLASIRRNYGFRRALGTNTLRYSLRRHVEQRGSVPIATLSEIRPEGLYKPRSLHNRL
jgi:hypothetical protein